MAEDGIDGIVSERPGLGTGLVHREGRWL